MLYIPVNSYGHVGTDSSPNHTLWTASSSNHSFFLDKLDWAANQYFAHILGSYTLFLTF